MRNAIAVLAAAAVLAPAARADTAGAALGPVAAALSPSPDAWLGRQLQLEVSLESPISARDRVADGFGSRLGLVWLRNIAGSATLVGSGVGYQRAIPQALLGTRQLAAGQTQILLTPNLVTVPFAMRLRLASWLYGALEPAGVVGWVTGAMRQTTGTPVDFSSSPGFGAQFSAGLELHPLSRFGLMLRAGYRWVRPSLSYDAASLGPGAPQPLHERVDVNLSGPFWSAGVVVRL